VYHTGFYEKNFREQLTLVIDIEREGKEGAFSCTDVSITVIEVIFQFI